MSNYFYNAFGELVKNKPKLINNFNNVYKHKEHFEDILEKLPDKPFVDVLFDTQSPNNCVPPYNGLIDGKCARINTCLNKETISSDNKYCIKNN